MTRKGQPKSDDFRPVSGLSPGLEFSTGAGCRDETGRAAPSPVASRKVKCDEAKPACARCTSTGRKCEGYAVVVPSNRAIARARSRTTRLRDALAQARAGWEFESDQATVEYFARDVAPNLPQNFENKFWSDLVPRLTIQSPAAMTPGISSIPELAEPDRQDTLTPTNPFTSPQSQAGGDDPDDDMTQPNDVDVVLSCCILFIATEFLRKSFDAAMQHLASGINILNNVDYDELEQDTLDEIVPKFHRLSIIQLCYYDKPGFPSLNLQHGGGTGGGGVGSLGGLGSRYNLGPFDKSSSIYLPKRAVDPILLDAIRYIRSADPGSQTDSRLASKGPVMSEEQKHICVSLDRWHAAFLAFVENPRKDADGDRPLPKHQGLICAETEMKYQAAKICISVCRSHDESVYDCFKENFARIVVLARLILDSCPDVPPETPDDFQFDFKPSFLSLVEFVIVKCRWLDIRYQAWLIAWELAMGRREPVTLGEGHELHYIGKRMIEREHNVSIEEVTRQNASLFSLPAEEMRVKDYLSDARFADLVQADDKQDKSSSAAAVQVPYTQRLLLRCGSCELDQLAGWMEGYEFSGREQ
ncbi:hypothetical protein CABS01_09033 [Colletotrichum abscissum]|uniref:uncharacterized protein n=1 Tax=Colletotrichum abscissum TaxID=1671311 RepID=UPI0027D5110E|nr:uncharacterized protein CABS01_09033 [Colletotrichum abscissum]KAK1503644.1 hypothetical protein CABS01_09033 [Colletotrichum abscissum]